MLIIVLLVVSRKSLVVSPARQTPNLPADRQVPNYKLHFFGAAKVGIINGKYSVFVNEV